MEKKASVKSSIISFVVLIVLAVLVYVMVLQFFKMNRTSEDKKMFSAASKERIVAEIDGTPISAFQVSLKRFFSEESLDDEAALKEIAREMFVLESAKAAGINISNDEIMEEIRSEEKYVESEAESGNQHMKQRQKDDKELLELLGMTKEEFNQEIYAQMLLYNKTFLEYGMYYVMNNSGSDMTFEEYIDAEFEKADIKIVLYDSEEK